MNVVYFTGEVKVAPRYAPATGGFYSVTEVKPCEMSGAYFMGEVEVKLVTRSSFLSTQRNNIKEIQT